MIEIIREENWDDTKEKKLPRKKTRIKIFSRIMKHRIKE